MNQENKQKLAFNNGSGDFDTNLSVSHQIKAPSIEDILRAAKKALAKADKTIASRGGSCECF